MKWLLYLLVLINIVVPAISIFKNCTSKNRVEVNHILLFSLAYIFYWILPIAIGLLRCFENKISMDIWYGIFDKVPPHILMLYLIFGLSCYIAFVAGSYGGERLSKKNILKFRGISFDRRDLNFLFLAGVVAASIFAYTLMDDFFMGYVKTGSHKWKGSFTASTVFLLSLAFINSNRIHEKYNFSTDIWITILNRFFVAYAIFAVLLASLGGRMFIVSSILMLLVYRTVYFKGMKYNNFFYILIGIAVLSTITAFLRAGEVMNMSWFITEDARSDLFFVFFSDTLFTGFSLIHFLKEYAMPIINYPIFLLNQLVNLVPTIILPSKAQFFLNPADFGYKIYSPAAALHTFVPLMLNFGLIGTIIFLFLFSFFLSFIKMNKTQPCRAMYVLISGWTSIAFFRDFNVTSVKLILEFSILMPILIVVFLVFLSRFTNRQVNS